MPDPDHDAEPERRTDPMYDAWPIRRYDAHTKWPIERAVPGEDEGRRTADLEWVGVFDAGATTGTPYLYDPEDEALVEARLDEDEERVVVEEAHERRSVDDEESLGSHLEDVGERHGWTWLSSFAREHLEDEAEGEGDRQQGLTYEHSRFDEKNLLEDAAPDRAYVGSHTFADEDDRTYVLEREFDVFLEDDARVTVREDVREATGEKRDRQAGDADLAGRVAFELAVDVEADEPGWERRLEDAVKAWHRDHRGPATEARSEGRSAAAPGQAPGE